MVSDDGDLSRLRGVLEYHDRVFFGLNAVVAEAKLTGSVTHIGDTVDLRPLVDGRKIAGLKKHWMSGASAKAGVTRKAAANAPKMSLEFIFPAPYSATS